MLVLKVIGVFLYPIPQGCAWHFHSHTVGQMCALVSFAVPGNHLCVCSAPPRSMAIFGRPLGPEYMSVWDAFRFKNPAKERLFQDRQQRQACRVSQVCCVVHALLVASYMVFSLRDGHTPAFYLSFLPGLAVALTCLVLVSCVPWAQRHAVIVTSVVMVLLVLCSSVTTEVSVREFVDLRHRELLPVFEALAHNDAASQQLGEFVQQVSRADGYTAWLLVLTLEALALLYCGFSKSTMAATVVIPCALLPIVVVMAPQGSLLMVVFRTVLWCALLLGMLPLSVRGTLSRRAQFLLEQQFAADLAEALDASRKADSILNHTLKNTMSEAAGEIEMFLGGLRSDTSLSHLRSSLSSLRRAMRSCHARQAYIQLSAAKYTLSLCPVRLGAFAAEYAAGRHMTYTADEGTVLIDPTLCGLLVDNAISNAFKHGHPEDPRVKFSIRLDGGSPSVEEALLLDAAPSAAADRVQVTFCVENETNPVRPTITPSYVESLLSSRAAPDVSRTCAFSDRIGLQQSFAAGDAHDMTCALVQIGSIVKFTASMYALRAPPAAAPAAGAGACDVTQFPADLHVHCIDDSGAARRLLEHNLRARANTDNVRLFGRVHSDVGEFVSATVLQADIAILDQHLEYGSDTNTLGTNLVRQLLSLGFPGLICIRSANSAPEDLELYFAAGAHVVFGKDEPMAEMILRMKQAYVRHVMADTD